MSQAGVSHIDSPRRLHQGIFLSLPHDLPSGKITVCYWSHGPFSSLIYPFIAWWCSIVMLVYLMIQLLDHEMVDSWTICLKKTLDRKDKIPSSCPVWYIRARKTTRANHWTWIQISNIAIPFKKTLQKKRKKKILTQWQFIQAYSNRYRII